MSDLPPIHTIHIRVPAATKGRWIRASRAAKMRLSEWIINAVEDYMEQQMAKVSILDDLDFSDLRLARDPDGSVSFDWDVIARICNGSGIPEELFRETSEDYVAGLIVSWYQAHRQNGGAADPVAEDLIAEVMEEEKAGQQVSYQPGSA